MIEAGKKVKSLTGQYGHLTVIELVRVDKKSKKAMWRCLCDCGNETIVRSDLLVANKVMSCGCYLKKQLSKKRADLVGKRFGALKVIEYVGVAEKNRSPIYLVECQVCRTRKEVRGYNLTSNRTKSCGCLKRQKNN